MHKKRLSSLLTFSYKFVIPLIFFGIIILLDYLLKKQGKTKDLISINITYIITMTLGYLPLLNIKKVWYDSKKLYDSNFFTDKEYKLETIKCISRCFFFFYKIHLDNNEKNKKIKFIPREFGNFRYLFKKPNTIIELEKSVAKRK